MKNVLIVVKEPGKEAEKRIVKDLELKTMQKIVGGYIELFPLDLPNGEVLDMFLNEEGKLQGLEPNLKISNKKGEIIDAICGTIFVCAHCEEGESIGLTEEQADAAIVALNKMGIKIR